MSLVNDALKRAKQAQKKGPPPPISGPAPRHIELVHQNSSAGLLWPLAIVALVVVIGGVLWFAVRNDGAGSTAAIVAHAKAASGSEHRSASASRPAQPTQNPAIAQPAAPPGAQPTSSVLASDAPAAVSSLTPADPVASAPPEPVTVTQMVAVATGPPPPPPLPKLQGIFYRPERPAALLDGRMMLIGKTVGEYRVVDISQQSVTVVRAGQTNLLEMPD